MGFYLNKSKLKMKILLFVSLMALILLEAPQTNACYCHECLDLEKPSECTESCNNCLEEKYDEKLCQPENIRTCALRECSRECRCERSCFYGCFRSRCY